MFVASAATKFWPHFLPTTSSHSQKILDMEFQSHNFTEDHDVDYKSMVSDRI